MAKKRIIVVLLLALQLIFLIIIGAGTGYFMAKGNVLPVIEIHDRLYHEPLDTLVPELEKLFRVNLVFDDQTVPLYFPDSYKKLITWVNEQYTSDSMTGIIAGTITYLNPFSRIKSYPAPLYDEKEVKERLQAIKTLVDADPVPATLTYQDGRLVLTPGKEGRLLNVEKTWQVIAEAQDCEIIPVIERIRETPSSADLREVKDLIGDYTTYFNPKERGRTTNIRLSAEALNGQLVPPGGIFSFNLVVGERVSEKGYMPADIYVDNTVVKGLGGGVCQTSSTLYQAVRQANLEIVERHRHTLPVDYVPPQGDATVAYGLLDFRFRNDTSSYVLISAETGKNYLRIRLFGKADARHPAIRQPQAYPQSALSDLPWKK